jgi:DNA-binding NarL/FixJ family response regulator
VDDEPIFREGLKLLLADVADVKVTGDAESARSAFALVDQQAPDLVLMDLALPGMDGLAATREIKRRQPRTEVLVFSVHQRARDVLEAFAAGARGYGLKTEPLEQLLHGMRCVVRGETYLSPALRSRGLSLPGEGRRRRVQIEGDPLGVLSEREREVFDLIVRGFKSAAIARELCIARKTVDTHRSRINQKLGCHSTADLIRLAATNGLLREGGDTFSGLPDEDLGALPFQRGLDRPGEVSAGALPNGGALHIGAEE